MKRRGESETPSARDRKEIIRNVGQSLAAIYPPDMAGDEAMERLLARLSDKDPPAVAGHSEHLNNLLGRGWNDA